MNRRYRLIFCILIFLVLSGCSTEKFDGTITPKETTFNINDYKNTDGAKAIFFEDKNNNIYKFIIWGSTGYAEYGYDIVASALSALSINTINTISQLVGADISTNVTQVNGVPYMECSINKFNNQKEKDQLILLMDSLKLGITSIQDTYGSEYLELIELR